jgi:hypothetical protein
VRALPPRFQVVSGRMVMSLASIRVEENLGRRQDFEEMIEKLKTDLISGAKKKYLITIA